MFTVRRSTGRDILVLDSALRHMTEQFERMRARMGQ